MALSEISSSVPREGLKWKNAHHVALMWAPNILHPRKLAANLRHPVHEVFHTNHKQYAVEMQEGVEYHVVEHRLLDKLVTVDVVTPDSFPNGLVPRVKQLFDPKFYYGHDKYFPQPFKLVDRTFVTNGFNQDEHVKDVLDSQRVTSQ